MSSDVSVKHQNHRDKLNEYREQQDQKLKKLQAEYRQREDAVRSAGEASINHIRKVKDEQTRSVRAETESSLQDMRQQAIDRLGELRKQTNARIVRQRDEGHQTINDLRKKVHEETDEITRTGDAKIANLNKETRESVLKTQERSAATTEKLHKEHEQKIQQIDVAGKNKIRQTQERHDLLLKELTDDSNQELETLKNEMNAREDSHRKMYQERSEQQAQTMEENLIRQREGFRGRYEKAQALHRDSLSNQKANFLKALYKQQQRFDVQTKSATDRAGDPFYQIRDFGASLTERSDSYLLSAQVEPYEKDVLDVRVQEDKVTLSQKRSFENSIDEDDSRMTTNSYQSARQDFKLEVPVDPEHIIKSMDENGVLTVLIPKKGHPRR